MFDEVFRAILLEFVEVAPAQVDRIAAVYRYMEKIDECAQGSRATR